MIFVDTSFWVAVAMRRDERHDESARLLELHADTALFTSNLVQGETWTFLRRRAGHASAVEFLSRRWLRRHDEREYSFVDATSFVLMRSLRSRDALAFDGHFSGVGLNELRPPPGSTWSRLGPVRIRR